MNCFEMNAEFPAVRLSSTIRLRQEYFGALVYDVDNGNTLEIDENTFQFLNLIKDKAMKINEAVTFLAQNNVIKGYDKSIAETVQKLFELQIIKKSNESSAPPVFADISSNKVSYKPWLLAPETVHWAITYRCDKSCPDCYTQRFSFIKKELNTNEALKIIDKIVQWNVFQLAIGGGEPFNREDLLQLIRHAARQGLSVHITTGRFDIDYHRLESISPFIKNLQFGVRPDDLIGAQSTRSIKQIKDLFDVVQKLGINSGGNLFLTRSAIERLEVLVNILLDLGYKRIIFLRYKPPKDIKRWKEEKPDSQQLKELHRKIGNIIKKNPQLNIRVDCALSFVQRYLTKELAAQFGIKGCVAASRIMALASDGSVYPCSQLVHPDYCAGNLLESDPELLWNQSHVLRRYRSFRAKKTFRHSWCGICKAKDNCGGCRVFTKEGLGQDLGCPEPLLPPLNQLGKFGRSLELVEYLKRNHLVSVEEYMERYKVGQRKAIKELNASPYAISTTGKSARKKKDTYKYMEEDIVLDIQNSIGATSGGVPFASYEEIAEWIEDSSYTEDYPEWIKNKGEENNEDFKYS